MERNRIYWLDGVKLFACIFVLWGHYAKAFQSPLLYDGIHIINSTLLSPVLNGEFWVCVFCILSGYFASRKVVTNKYNLIVISLMRYLKFAVSFFFINGLIYVLNLLGAFTSFPCGELIQNNWIGKFYMNAITGVDVLKSTVLLSSNLNAPFWMIKSLLLGSVLMYGLNYVTAKMNATLKRIVKMLAITLCFVIPSTFFVSVCMLGGCLDELWNSKWLDKNNKIPKVILFVSILMLCGFQNYVANKINCRWLLLNEKWHVLYAFMLLVSLGYIISVKSKLESYHIIQYSQISFGVYLLHWPILCSFSTFVIMQGVALGVPYTLIYLLGFVLINIVVVLCAKVYSITIEKVINILLRKMNGLFMCVIKLLQR